MKKELTERQKEILEFISQFIENNGYPPTLREIGANFNIASTNGVKRHLSALEKKGYLSIESNASRALSVVGADDSVESSNENTHVVPIIGRVAAGYPILAEENIEGKLALDAGLFKFKPGSFALKVRGDSMVNAGIFENDVVVITPEKEARNGEIIVALLNDEATLKRYVKQNNDWFLMPENENYTPISVKGREDFSIVGKVKAVIRTFN